MQIGWKSIGINLRLWIRMNPDQFFNSDESEVEIIRLENFVRNERLRFNRIEFWFGLKISDWFLIALHQLKLKIFFGLTRISSEINRNKSHWFGMNFNPKLLSGISYERSHCIN